MELDFYPQKMRCLGLLMFISLLLGCKKDDNNQVLDLPAKVTGSIYGVPFTANANVISTNPVSADASMSEEYLSIYFDDDGSKTCSSPVDDFELRIRTPKKVGKFSSGDATILVTDPHGPAGHQSTLFSSAQTIVSIDSIVDEKVKGQVNINLPKMNIHLTGRFEVTTCH
jgi:hypothetical protein